jgi:Fe-S cluster assembly ATP-binding protein
LHAGLILQWTERPAEKPGFQENGRNQETMTQAQPTLAIRDLHVSVDETEILKGVDLSVSEGEVHALMGPNGAGKSTLGNTIMGHPRYVVTRGDILYRGESILTWTPDERARAGIFLSFQYPTAIPGVTMVNFLRQAVNAVRGEDMHPREFRTLLTDKMKLLKVPDEMARRYLNEGFSGGEKKKAEILQLGVLQPRLAILDETDSGLDVDALRTVAEGVNALAGPELGILIITHYNRILNYIRPDVVHVLIEGRIARSGGADLASEIEERGYDWLTANATA